MIDTYSRHRPLALLAIVVVAQVMLLAFQIKGEHDVRLIRYWAVALVTPLERAGTWSFSKVGGAWGGYVGLRNARAENDRMRIELDQLRLRNRELESQAAEAQRLATVLNFRSAHPEAQMLAAQVIGSSADPTSHTLFINRGEHDRLRMNMGVVTPDGIVGKIVEVLPNTAQVLLINDKDSGVGALFSSTRTHGVVRGSGDPEPRMEYVVNDEKVQRGRRDRHIRRRSHFPEGLSDRDSGKRQAGKSVPGDSRAAQRAARPAGRSVGAVDAARSRSSRSQNPWPARPRVRAAGAAAAAETGGEFLC